MRLAVKVCLLCWSGLLVPAGFGQTPDFSIGASPSSQTVWQANSTTYLITVTPSNGFSASVALSVTGLPAQATASFNPAAINGSGTSTMTVNAAPGTPTGSSTLTVTGVSGALSHGANVTLSTVVPPPITYTYDPVGRLTSVTDQTGNSAIYSYDAVGNLLSISRQNANQVTIAAFSPSSGSPGTKVTILGSGFSSTPSQNALTFNGTAAVVLTSSNTLITANVPVAATTGPIAVSVTGSGNATSASSFTVNPALGIPTISSFGPTLAAASATLTITGTNFDPNPAGNTVKISGTTVPVLSATSTTLTLSVPSTCGSGHISVQTAAGTAVSAGDFFFVPLGYSVPDVIATARVSGSQAQMSTFSAGNQVGLIIFDGTQGAALRLLTNTSTQNQTISVYGPDGALIIGPTAIQAYGAGFVQTPALPATGTYTAVIKDDPGFQGQVTLAVSAIPSASDFAIFASSEPYQVYPAGQSYRVFVSFGASFTQTVNLSATGLPTGATASFNPASLAANGSSQLTFTLSGVAAGTYSFTLSATGGAVNHTLPLTLLVDPLPSPWQDVNIDEQIAGRSEYSSGVFTLTGSGGGNIFAADSFHLAYQSLSGDGTIVARVVSMYNSPSSQAALGGLMIRETLTDTSTVFQLRLNSLAGAEVLTRTTTSGGMSTNAGPTVKAPYWLKLTRQGNAFSAFVSQDGAVWTQVGTSTTISMSASVFVGITAAGSNFGNLAQVVFDNVSVTTTPDFSLTATPGSQTVAVGAAANYTVSVGALGGFSGTVSLTASGLPTGATPSFAPSSVVAPGSSTLTITTASNTPPGTYTITLTGVSGAISHTSAVTLTVGGPDFSVGVAPTSATTNISTSTSYTVSVGFINAFAGTVNLSISGVPSGSTATFSPTSLTTAGNSTLTVTVGANTAARSYPLVITGTSGAVTHSVTATLIVAPSDFAISLDTPWMTFPGAGGTVTRNITTTVANGFTKTITLSATSLPAGASATFNPPSITAAGTSVVTLTMPAGLSPGNYSASIAGTAIDPVHNNPTHSTPLALVVYAAGALPSGWTDIDIGSVGIPGFGGFTPLTFTEQGSGTGTGYHFAADQVHFTYQSLNGDGTVIARIASVQNLTGQAGVMIRESLDPAAAMAFLELQNNGSNVTYDAWLMPRATTGALGDNIGIVNSHKFPYWVKLVRQGSTFTCYLSPDGINWGTPAATATISMTTSALAGIAVDSGNNGTMALATFDNVLVTGASADFYIVPTPLTRSVSNAAATTSYHTVALVALNGFTSNTTTLSVSGLPTGATSSFSISPLPANGTTNLQINIPAGVTVGSYPITITAVNGALSHSTMIVLNVTAGAASPAVPWAADDLGFDAAAGSSSVGTTTITVQGAGNTLNGTSEAFRYTYQALTGDGAMIVRLDSWANLSDSGRAGIMIRESLEPDSRYVFMCIRADVFFSTTLYPDFQYRATGGGSTTEAHGSPLGLPYWLKLVRQSGVFTGYISSNGITWTQIGQVDSSTLTMANSTFIGAAVSSGNPSVLSTASFSNITIGTGFYLVATPSSRTFNSGNATDYFYLNAQPFSTFPGSVALTATNLPAGASASFTSTPIAVPGSSVLEIDTTAATPPGTYTVTITGTSGATSVAAQVTVVVGTTTNGFTSPWGFDYIGNATAGTPAAGYSNGVYTLSSTNGALSGTADGLALAARTMTGDGNITAHLTARSGVMEAGVMLRETIDPGSKYAAVGNNSNIKTSDRSVTGGNSQFLTGLVGSVPLWLRLTRQGTNVGFYSSADASNWQQVTTATLSFANTILAGVYNSGTGNSTLDNVTIDQSNDFFLGFSPLAPVVAPGASTPVTVNAFSQGSFSGTINWSVSNLPANVSGLFNPTSTPGAGSTTLTLTAGAGAMFGSYSITVTGTSGALSHSLTIPLTISPDFTVTITPSTQTVWLGRSTSYTVTVTPLAGFNSNVALSVFGLPLSSGSLTLSPATITGGSGTSTLTANINSNAPQFPSTLTLTATGAGISHTATTALVIGPEFSVSMSIGPTIIPGQSGSATATVTPYGGFNSNVALTALNLPASVTATFNPSLVTGGSGTSTMTINTTTQATGNIVTTIQGTGGGLTRSVPMTIFMKDFSLSVNPSSQTIVAGGTTANYVIGMAFNNGYTGTINFATANLPVGATPSSISSLSSPGTRNLTIMTTTGLQAGTYPFTITGTNSVTGLQRTLPATLVVTSDFTLSVSPSTVTITAAGASGTDTITVAPLGGFNSAVTLSVAGLPSGASGTFGTNPVTGGSGTSVLTLSATSAAAGASYTLTVTGTSGSLVHTKTFTLTIKNFTLAAPPVSVAAGGSGTSTVTLTMTGGFASSVSFGTTGLPSGAGATFFQPALSATGTSTMTVTAAGGMTAGSYPFNITGTSGSLVQSIPATLTVTNGFSLSNSGNVTVTAAGTNGTATITLTASPGLTGATALTVAGLPTNATATFNPTSVTGSGSTSTLTFVTPATVAGGTSTITVTGTNGGLTRTTTLTLTVKNFSLTLSKSSLTVTHGGNGTNTVTVVAAGGFSSSVAFSGSGQGSGTTLAFSPPSSPTSSVLTVTASSGAAHGTFTITVTGTVGSLVQTKTFTLIVN